MQDEVRLSVPGDEPGLMELWKRVFGDEDQVIEGFFEKIYAPGMASVYVRQGRIVSAAYVFRLGELVSDGRWTPCRCIYAYATDPEHRGRGYGRRVLEDACGRATTSGATVICPVSPSLFGTYARRGFGTYFSAVERHCTDVGSALSGSVSRVTVRGYAALREELLHGRVHIDFDIRALEYQEQLCRDSGGGLYYVVSEGVRCCAAVELNGEEALIRELIVPSGSQYNAAALVARAVRREKFTYRAPERQGDEAAPFAMLFGFSDPVRPTPAPWLGFSFE